MNAWELPVTALAIALCVAGILACTIVRERIASAVLAIACCSASILSLIANVGVLADGESGLHVLWSLPLLGPVAVGTTHLGALFSCFAALVYVPTSLFTVKYLQRYAHEYSLRAFTCWYCLLLAAVISLFVCRDTASFFIVWEIVAITSSALVAYEWRHERNARAAFLMLTMSEAGTMAAIVAVLLALRDSHSLLFSTGAVLNGSQAWAVFLLSFFGFGVKAGLLPVNSWLPRAHPLAPGNVSALLSGVILNLGVYGILLVNMELAPVHISAEGMVMVAIGAISALVGILYATIDDDLKAMLAYSSIENIGIAIVGLGVGLVFTAQHQPLFAALGFAAGAYHLVNHSVYKGLLFLGAATVDVQMGTRSMNRLGGVIRYLPVTAAFFLIGTLSIAAIPPLNGFASEWLTFQALLRSVELSQVGERVVFASCGALLALTAALAITCFVKAFGMTFLGQPRTRLPDAGEPARSMRLGMVLLAIECVLLGIFPTYALSTIGTGLADLTGAGAVNDALVPAFFAPGEGAHPLPVDFVTTFHALGAQIGMGLPGRGFVVMLRGGSANPVVFAMSTTYLAFILLILLIAIAVVVWFVARSRRRVRTPVWAGGLQPLLPEMTYTATGFSNPVRVIFDRIFHPIEIENSRETIHEHFRSAIRRTREDIFLGDRIVLAPVTTATLFLASLFARIHHGRLPVYVGYAIGTLLLVLLIVSIGNM